MAAAIAAPSKCCFFISLSDLVKLHGQFQIGSILHQQEEIAACKRPHQRKKQYLYKRLKEMKTTLTDKGFGLRFQNRTFFKARYPP